MVNADLSETSPSEWFGRLPDDVRDQAVRVLRAVVGMSEEEKMNAAICQVLITAADGPSTATKELAEAVQDLLLRADENANPARWEF